MQELYVYVRTLYSDTSGPVCLVTAKTKVAQLQTQSIPRLELCDAPYLAKSYKQSVTI